MDGERLPRSGVGLSEVALPPVHITQGTFTSLSCFERVKPVMTCCDLPEEPFCFTVCTMGHI